MKDTDRNTPQEGFRLTEKEEEAIARKYEESQPSRPTPAWWANTTTWWVAGIIVILALFFIIWIWN